VFPASILVFSAGYFHRALVDESRMIRTQKGMNNRSEIIAIYGTPCAIPPRNSNSKRWTWRAARMGEKKI
jgi:hypothetical protein